MSETFEIDYDAEAVLLDGAWLSREELATKIRQLLEAGEYRISRLSMALERLEAALAAARLLTVRVSEEVAQALEAEASRRGRSQGALLRDLILRYLEESAMEKNGSLGIVEGRWFDTDGA